MVVNPFSGTLATTNIRTELSKCQPLNQCPLDGSPFLNVESVLNTKYFKKDDKQDVSYP